MAGGGDERPGIDGGNGSCGRQKGGDVVGGGSLLHRAEMMKEFELNFSCKQLMRHMPSFI